MKLIYGYYILGGVLIIVLLLLLQPKISSGLFPSVRQARYLQFVQDVRGKGEIDPKVFWQFRDFYGPGSFVLERSSFGSTKAGYKGLTFSKFSSSHLTSSDSLVSQPSLKSILNISSVPTDKAILQGKNFLLYQIDPKTVNLIFLLPSSDLIEVTGNGFFDYNGADAALLKGRYWLDRTTILLN